MARAKASMVFVLVASALSVWPNSKLRADTKTPDKINDDRDINEGNLGHGSGRSQPFKAVPAGYNLDMVKKWVAAHQASHGTDYKYVYVPFDGTSTPDTLNELRVAAGKAWNHLSWLPDVDIPEDVSDGAGLVFGLNTKKVWGADADKNWNFIANCTPKRNIQVSPAPVGDCKRFAPNDPVDIPRFVFNATNGGPYANIHQTPPFFQNFRQKFKLGPIKAVSTQKEAIVCGPRMTAYRMVDYKGQQLLYSYTSDEFDGRDRGNIRYKSAPTDRDQRSTGSLRAAPNDDNTAVASEWWIQLPNGFMYYGIHGEGSQERGKAEFPFAIDPANWKQNAVLANGRSCISCHANGIQSAPSDQEYAGKDGWTSNEDLTVMYSASRSKFQHAMRTLVDNLSDGSAELNEHMVNGTVEVVSKANMRIEGAYRAGRNGSCESFCNGKFGSRRRNLCDTLPAR